MAHYKRRRRTDPRRADQGRKSYFVRGVRKGAPYGECWSNVRQALKRDIWAGWES